MPRIDGSPHYRGSKAVKRHMYLSFFCLYERPGSFLFTDNYHSLESRIQTIIIGANYCKDYVNLLVE